MSTLTRRFRRRRAVVLLAAVVLTGAAVAVSAGVLPSRHTAATRRAVDVPARRPGYLAVRGFDRAGVRHRGAPAAVPGGGGDRRALRRVAVRLGRRAGAGRSARLDRRGRPAAAAGGG